MDWIAEGIGVLALFLLVGLPAYSYGELPEVIPRHFRADGTPDGFSGKGIVWLLPGIGVLLYAGLFWLNRYPHLYNYPQKVTKENAGRLYRAGTRLIRSLNVFTAWGFAYITHATIQTALGNQEGLGKWFLPVFLIVPFGITGYYLFRGMGGK